MDVDLKLVFETLEYLKNKEFKTHNMTIFIKDEIKAHPPGRLSNILAPEQIYESNIGSIQFKFILNKDVESRFSNVSVLLFKTSMKISGGISEEINKEIQTSSNSDDILKNYITILSNIISECLFVETMKPNICLINANERTPYKFDNFIQFCETNFEGNKKYARVVMPLTKARGRVGAVKLYPYKSKKASAHFDQGGKIQYFGFNTVRSLLECSNSVNNELKNI